MHKEGICEGVDALLIIIQPNAPLIECWYEAASVLRSGFFAFHRLDLIVVNGLALLSHIIPSTLVWYILAIPLPQTRSLAFVFRCAVLEIGHVIGNVIFDHVCALLPTIAGCQ